MTTPEDDDLKRLIEAERNGQIDSAEYWRLYQEILTRAVNRVGRNTPAACKANERRILASMKPPPKGE
jgi:hypothetical protein